MKICIITAGGAGMFCGSCMQDNTQVRSLRAAGADALLLPTYTPVRVDEENVSGQRVFMGGINVYLDSRLPGWRYLPSGLKRWLDKPGVVRLLSRLSSSTSAAQLGPLTVDLLNGVAGPQKSEIAELVRYLAEDLRPEVILFSNALLSGVVPSLRKHWKGTLICMLQGDDVFLEDLPEPWKSRSLELIRRNCSGFDQFLTHSDYYTDFMSQYLSLPKEKFQRVQLAIEEAPETSQTVPADAPHSAPFTVGYFARICPEKGVFTFLDAAEAVLPQRPDMRMVIAGFLPGQHENLFRQRYLQVRQKVGEQLQWAGSPPGRPEKFKLLQSFDWLCVPTAYREPKGLYVLEAALAGVPSLLPAHGAFPERLRELQAGALYDPATPDALQTALKKLLPSSDPEQQQRLRQRCLSVFGMRPAGQLMLKTIQAAVLRAR
jgi:glycosyltransferase involved in cell wall biosynthesis